MNKIMLQECIIHFLGWKDKHGFGLFVWIIGCRESKGIEI